MPFPAYVSDTTYGVSTLLLTSREELQRLFSQRGEDLWTEDIDEDNDATYDTANLGDVTKVHFLEETIQFVSSEVMSYLMPRYQVQHVYQIPRIRQIATYFLAYRLTMRRGNEPLYEREYLDGIDELEAYRLGSRYLDAPSSGQRAYIQSYVHDNRFSRFPIRVISEGSTSLVDGQHVAIRYAFSWL